MTPTVRTFAPLGAVIEVLVPETKVVKEMSNAAVRLSFEETILRRVDFTELTSLNSNFPETL